MRGHKRPARQPLPISDAAFPVATFPLAAVPNPVNVSAADADTAAKKLETDGDGRIPTELQLADDHGGLLELPAGTRQQVDYAADGADVTVKRTVTRNGQVISEDQVFTRYEPWQAIFKVGTGGATQ